MKRAPLTLKGAERLRLELKRLKLEERPRIIQAIAEARSHGVHGMGLARKALRGGCQ